MTTSIEWLLRCWSSSDISNVVSPIINTFFFLGCGFNTTKAGNHGVKGGIVYYLLGCRWATLLSLSGAEGQEVKSWSLQKYVRWSREKDFAGKKVGPLICRIFGRKTVCFPSINWFEHIWTMGYQGFERTGPERPISTAGCPEELSNATEL